MRPRDAEKGSRQVVEPTDYHMVVGGMAAYDRSRIKLAECSGNGAVGRRAFRRRGRWTDQAKQAKRLLRRRFALASAAKGCQNMENQAGY